MPQQRVVDARISRGDGKILHRQKRGWMWNQFFLLEEYTGSDYQYVGKVSIIEMANIYKGSLKFIVMVILSLFLKSLKDIIIYETHFIWIN